MSSAARVSTTAWVRATVGSVVVVVAGAAVPPPPSSDEQPATRIIAVAMLITHTRRAMDRPYSGPAGSSGRSVGDQHPSGPVGQGLVHLIRAPPIGRHHEQGPTVGAAEHAG